jgi:hypothetical protein
VTAVPTELPPTVTNTATDIPTQTLTSVPTSTPEPTTTPTNTSTPTNTPTPTIVPPVILPKETAAKFRLDNSLSSFEYERLIFLTQSGKVKVGLRGWFALNKKTLEDNLKKMTWKLSIDDNPIEPDNFSRNDSFSKKNGQDCPTTRFFVILDQLPVGTHKITSGYSIDENINDGFSNYPPDSTTYLNNRLIYVFNEESKEKDPSKWPVVFNEDFSTDSDSIYSNKTDDNSNIISAKVENGVLLYDFEKIEDSFANSFYLGKIMLDKYQISVDVKEISNDADNGKCLGLVFNRDRSITNAFPYYNFAVCNSDFVRLFKVSKNKIDTVFTKDYKKSSTGVTNLSVLVNKSHVTFYANNEIMKEMDLSGMSSNRSFELGYVLISGDKFKSSFDNLIIKMPVNPN